MAIADPSIHESERVGVYADEYAANYFIIYYDELEVDDYPTDSNDVQAECDEIAAAGRQVNPNEVCRGTCPSRQT